MLVGCQRSCLILSLQGIFGSSSQGFFRSNFFLGPVISGLFLPSISGIFSSAPQALRQDYSQTSHLPVAGTLFKLRNRCIFLLSGNKRNNKLTYKINLLIYEGMKLPNKRNSMKSAELTVREHGGSVQSNMCRVFVLDLIKRWYFLFFGVQRSLACLQK